MPIPTREYEQHFEELYEALRDLTIKCEMASARENEARRVLSDARQKILAETEDPKALGSNEAQRAAKLAEKTAALGSRLAAAEEIHRNARFDLELHRTRIEEAKAVLRIRELAVREDGR